MYFYPFILVFALTREFAIFYLRRHLESFFSRLYDTTGLAPHTWMGAAVAEWLSSWLAVQEDRGSIPGLVT